MKVAEQCLTCNNFNNYGVTGFMRAGPCLSRPPPLLWDTAVFGTEEDLSEYTWSEWINNHSILCCSLSPWYICQYTFTLTSCSQSSKGKTLFPLHALDNCLWWSYLNLTRYFLNTQEAKFREMWVGAKSPRVVNYAIKILKKKKVKKELMDRDNSTVARGRGGIREIMEIQINKWNSFNIINI